MLNNVVNNQEQYGQQNIVQACFQQHCYRLGVFSRDYITYTAKNAEPAAQQD
jgi:hypothetical protein